MVRRYVAYSELGHRIGETHPRATISDETVDMIREYHEERGWSYERISRKVKISYHTIAKLCRYERRAQVPARWRRVDV